LLICAAKDGERDVQMLSSNVVWNRR
jgi:hypothetical protein